MQVPAYLDELQNQHTALGVVGAVVAVPVAAASLLVVREVLVAGWTPPDPRPIRPPGRRV